MRRFSTKRYLAAGSAAIFANMSGILAPAALADETAPTALADLEKSIVLIETEWSGFIQVPAYASADSLAYRTDELTYSTICTAFFVSETAQLATAGHCVDPADGRRVILEGYIADQEAPDFLGQALAGWLVEGDEAGKPLRRTVFGYQPEHVDGASLNSRASTLEVIDFKPSDSGNVALLRVPNLSKQTPAMPIADDAPAVGADLESIGFSGILRGVSDQTQIARASFKTGSVSSRQVSPQGVVQIEVNTDLQGGMSGGPTVNGAGEVVGVNSNGVNAAGNFNFVTNTADLRSFLSTNNVEFVDAKAAAPKDDGSEAGRILAIVGGLVLIALTAGGAFFLLKRDSKPAGGTPPSSDDSSPPTSPPPDHGGSPSAGSPDLSSGPPEPSSAPMSAVKPFCSNCGAVPQANEECCHQCVPG